MIKPLKKTKFIFLISIFVMLFLIFYITHVWDKEDEKRAAIAIELKNEIEKFFKMYGYYPDNLDKLSSPLKSIDLKVFLTYKPEDVEKPQNFVLIWRKTGLTSWNGMVFFNKPDYDFPLKHQIISKEPDKNGFYEIDLH